MTAPAGGRVMYHGSLTEAHGPGTQLGPSWDNAATLTDAQLDAVHWTVLWYIRLDNGRVLKHVGVESFTHITEDAQ